MSKKNFILIYWVCACDVLETREQSHTCRPLFVSRRIKRFVKAESSAYTNSNTKQQCTATVELENDLANDEKSKIKAKPSKVKQSLKFRDRIKT